ncbi:MAG: demethoxyubiquinone hydroxylase family protein [Chloroflexi bacterium]|nr:demethoxyubiquinone hydroxylase family protein [Chloroflexota bacterium]MDA8187441.1 demethoxyubiquinone hydroxylase family protein [Dehalococcoidales bacterium]
MSFTDPFTGITPGRKLNAEETLRALRIDVAAELDATNLYQAHIDAIDDERVKAVIAHIRDEEKEHIAEFIALINELDPTQSQKFQAEHPQTIESGQMGVLPTEQGAAGQTAEARAQIGMQLTVGSLLGQEQS